jgi:rubrerythrin
MAAKSFYKCKVCGDIHYGASAPDVCPTCKQKGAYAPVGADDARKAMGL